MALNLGKIFYQLGVETAGLNKADAKVKTFTRSTKQSFGTVDKAARRLTQTLGAVVSIEMGRRALLVADNFASLQDRIKSVVDDTESANFLFKKLQQTAARTGQSIETIAGGFQKISFSKDALGATDAQMLQLSDTFANLGVISSTSMENMNSVILQFSQGLVSGKFQAQEFQSVVEGMPAIMGELAKGMGITTSQLINMKREGELLSKDVFQGLLNRTDQIAARAEKMPIRLNRGWARFQLGIAQAMSKMDESVTLTGSLSEKLFEAGDAIAEIPVSLEAMIKTFKNLNIEGAKFVSLAKGIMIVTAAMVAFKTAVALARTVWLSFMAVTPVGIFIALSAAVVGLLVHFDKFNFVVIGLIATFKNFFSQVVAGVKDLINVVLKAFKLIASVTSRGPGYIDRMKDSFNEFTAALAGPNTAAAMKKTVSDIKSGMAAVDQGGLLAGIGEVTGFDPGNLDITKGYQDTLKDINDAAREAEIAAQEEFNAKQQTLAEVAAGDQMRLLFSQKNRVSKLEEEARKKKVEADAESVKQTLNNGMAAAADMAGLQKELALFNIAVKIPSAVASAYDWGLSTGGGPYAAAAAAIAAGGLMAAQMAAVGSQSFTPRAIGGDVFPNQQYLVNENGPELFNFGGKDILSTGSARGTITPNGASPGGGNSGGGSGIMVNVFPTPGQTASVQQSTDSEGQQKIDIILQKIDASMADGISEGTSQTGKAMENVFGLNRGLGNLG